MEKKYLITFTGRPNAGKTTCLKFFSKGYADPSRLAKLRAGKSAGTTKRIMEIEIGPRLSMVDLPGFGRIMKRSHKFIEKTKDSIVSFIEDNAKDIVVAVQVIDASTFWIAHESLMRKGIKNIDIEMVTFLKESGIPNIIVLGNKTDRLSNKEQRLEEIAKLLPEMVHFLPVSMKKRVNTGAARDLFTKLLIETLGLKTYRKEFVKS
ncbi:MAG: GTPase [Candidatus Hodarchaeales archaeon]